MRLSALRFVLLILLAGLVLSSCAAAELVTEDDDSLIFLSIDALSDPALDSEEETDDEEVDDPSFSMEMNDDSDTVYETVSDEPYSTYLNPQSTSDDHTLTFSFLGDCSIGDTIKSVKRKNSMTGTLAEHSPDWLFSTVSEILHADDFTFANLECVLTDNMSPLYPLKTFNLVGPSKHRDILAESGIDGINTVNNH